jgi:membrane protein DedA with SNARE-associated domain
MDLQDTFNTVLAFVRENQAWAAPVVFVLAFGESLAFVSLVLPFWAILVAVGTLVGAGDTANMIAVWISASVGAALGDWVSYWLGFRYQNEIARAWPLSKHPGLLDRGHRFFDRWGTWAIVIGRFWGPLRASVPIAAGIARMPWLRFQGANFGSAFLWAFVLMSPGALWFRL